MDRIAGEGNDTFPLNRAIEPVDRHERKHQRDLVALDRDHCRASARFYARENPELQIELSDSGGPCAGDISY